MNIEYDLKKAAKMLKGHCVSTSCHDCIFDGEKDDDCSLLGFPSTWKIPKSPNDACDDLKKEIEDLKRKYEELWLSVALTVIADNLKQQESVIPVYKICSENPYMRGESE